MTNAHRHSFSQQNEWLKLCRLLEADESEADFLKSLPEAELRRLRSASSEWLFSQHKPLFRRLAKLAQWVPNWIAVWLCQRMGPLLCARIVGDLPARRAAQIAHGIPVPFLAQVSRHLDPRRARDLIQIFNPDLIVKVARAMLAHGDYVTMGRFVEYLPDEAIVAVLESEPDEAELIRITAHIDSKNRLDHVVRLLPEARRQRALLLALDEKRNLLDEILTLVFNVNHAIKRELGDLAAQQNYAVLERIILRVHQLNLWGEMLAVIACLSPPNRQKVINLRMLRDDPSIIPAILKAAEQHHLWRIVLPMAELLDETMRDVFAEASSLLSPEALRESIHAVLIGELWEPMLDMVRRMRLQKQVEYVECLKQFLGVDAALDARLIARAQAHQLTPALQAAGLA